MCPCQKCVHDRDTQSVGHNSTATTGTAGHGAESEDDDTGEEGTCVWEQHAKDVKGQPAWEYFEHACDQYCRRIV